MKKREVWKYNTFTGKPIFMPEFKREENPVELYCEKCGKKTSQLHKWNVGSYNWLCTECSNSFYKIMHGHYPSIYP